MKSAGIESFSDDAGTVEVRDVAAPTPGPGQVRVRMRMAPVNPSDFNYIDGIYERSFARMIWNRGVDRPTDRPGSDVFPRPPYSLGVEGVGVDVLDGLRDLRALVRAGVEHRNAVAASEQAVHDERSRRPGSPDHERVH